VFYINKSCGKSRRLKGIWFTDRITPDFEIEDGNTRAPACADAASAAVSCCAHKSCWFQFTEHVIVPGDSAGPAPLTI
jgi:hypothetical protein